MVEYGKNNKISRSMQFLTSCMFSPLKKVKIAQPSTLDIKTLGKITKKKKMKQRKKQNSTNKTLKKKRKVYISCRPIKN